MRWLLLLAMLLGLAWKLVPGYLDRKDAGPASQTRQAVAVEAEKILVGPIALNRTFSGALESCQKFVVAPKVSGRVEELAVDIGDRVRQGQVVARLDHGEFAQAVTQAQADLAVAQANLAQARSSLEIAERDLNRVKTLRKQGVSSEAQLDAALSARTAAGAGQEIAQAQVVRARAALETARIRLGYTAVTADWQGRDDWRVVAETFVAQGDMVGVNSPLAAIVDLDPLTGVIFVSETDYGSLGLGQAAELTCDAFPEKVFSGKIARIAPVFGEGTRQARVELTVANPDQALKPGMFVRTRLVLAAVDRAVTVPETALVLRNGHTGVFLVREGERTVDWSVVVPGIRDQGRVQVTGLPESGQVVTLGQQMLDQGSEIQILDRADQP